MGGLWTKLTGGGPMLEVDHVEYRCCNGGNDTSSSSGSDQDETVLRGSVNDIARYMSYMTPHDAQYEVHLRPTVVHVDEGS